MSVVRQWIGLLVVAEALMFATNDLAAQGAGDAVTRRPVTIADMISMVRVSGPYPDSEYSPANNFAVFSPGAQYFVLAVSRGNLEKNSTESTLLLFRTADLPHARPRRLLTLSSSSNQAGISEIRWAPDGKTIYFLGSRGEDPTQLFALRLSSGRIAQLTHHATSVESYALSGSGIIAYAAEPAVISLITPAVLKYGFRVTTESPVDLVRGELVTPDAEIFVRKEGSSREFPLRTAGGFDTGINDLYLSPDGRHLVVKTTVRNAPSAWAGYDDANIKAAFRTQSGSHSNVRILRYELLDISTRKSEILLDAPTTYRSNDVLWAPDSESVILGGTYLPLNDGDPLAWQARKLTRFVMEVRLQPRKIVEITEGDLRPLHWNANANIVDFAAGEDEADQAPAVSYRKTASGWVRLHASLRSSNAPPVIELKQDLNSPPEVAAVDPNTKKAIPFWNLNPQFTNLAFGRVEIMEWRDSSGKSLRGALYLPPDYDSRQRYPLVIQTHGLDSASFSMTGYYTTAFAAQPLAARGIVVLQIDDIFYDSLETPKEPERAMAAYESAIDDLDRRGIIDPTRVGIIGFSRTSLYVKYALTHSPFHFAAAIICDGFDAGYFQYLLFANSIPFRDSEIDAVIGASPFGAGISEWLKRSPGFLLRKVEAPILIQAIGPTSLMGEWEWFAGLTRLNRPVDLIYLPAGTHVLVKPWDRMVSEGGTVDWFCFWLKGEQDADPENAPQYARWTQLRRQTVNSGAPN